MRKAGSIQGAAPTGARENHQTDTAGIDYAPTQIVAYTCARGHTFTVPLAADVTPPDDWPCSCGIDNSNPRDGQGAKTPLEHLHERRTVEELEAALRQRLKMLRAGEIGPHHED